MLRGIIVSVACLVIAATATSRLRGAETDDDGTHWIWSRSPRETGSAVRLHKRFRASTEVASARIRCHADFCDAVVILNGVEVVRAQPYDSLPQADVARHVRSGENVLVVRAVGTGGPAAVAVELDLTLAGGTHQVIRSDSSWKSGEPAAEQAAVAHGRVNREAWWRASERPRIGAFDEYNQWEEALGSSDHGDPAKIQLPAGYTIELLHRARGEEGSWISLAVDPRGRLIVGKEKKGLLRLTLPASGDADLTVEVIDESLRGSHGLVWAGDSLYVNASDSKALYRLRDTGGDDRFDDVRLLKQIPGATGDHGRNDLIEAPGGGLYAIHGDAVRLPDEFQSRVPPTRAFGPSRRPRGGHLVRTDFDGKTWEVVAAGLRNPYGIAANIDGELFTYDADSESHLGLPWYRPTRMNHLVSGADYGWRLADTPWPIYSPDSLPPNLLIGRSSPTGVMFATKSAFPPDYRSALFALDWAFGRIFAVHVVPRGASYSMHAETFLRGRPFNVVDLDFASDGSMYLITGGYKTRSALYRLRYVGPELAEREPTGQERARAVYAGKMRRLRQRLESLHQPESPAAVATAWPLLDHSDRWIRHAARIAIEHQDVQTWEERAWNETRTRRALPALMALARVGPSLRSERLRSKLARLSVGDLTTEWKLMAVRVAELVDEYDEGVGENIGLGGSARVLAQFEPLYPSGERSLDRELCKLLARHGSEEVARKTLGILATESSHGDMFHYLSVLADHGEGWSPERRAEYFRILRGARLFQGDVGLPRHVRQLEKVALASVPEDERGPLERLLARDATDASADSPPSPRAFVKNWTLADLEKSLADTARTADLERGAVLYRDALCSQCHRLGAVGRFNGPDLTAVSARFGRRELIESILSPSKVVSSRYRNHAIVTADGRVISGQVVWNGFRKSIVRIATDPMRLEEFTEIAKRDIVLHNESSVSPMPEGLLDTLTRDEVLDLLAYVESAGGRRW